MAQVKISSLRSLGERDGRKYGSFLGRREREEEERKKEKRKEKEKKGRIGIKVPDSMSNGAHGVISKQIYFPHLLTSKPTSNIFEKSKLYFCCCRNHAYRQKMKHH